MNLNRIAWTLPLLLLGLGIRSLAQETVDDRTKFKDIKLSAEKGSATSQFALGLCYFQGRGVNKDLGEAVKWFRMAAEQGEAGAQFILGFSYAESLAGPSYETGLSLREDYPQAIKWLQRAADQGFAPAQASLGLCYAQGRGVPK